MDLKYKPDFSVIFPSLQKLSKLLFANKCMWVLTILTFIPNSFCMLSDTNCDNAHCPLCILSGIQMVRSACNVHIHREYGRSLEWQLSPAVSAGIIVVGGVRWAQWQLLLWSQGRQGLAARDAAWEGRGAGEWGSREKHLAVESLKGSPSWMCTGMEHWNIVRLLWSRLGSCAVGGRRDG